MAFVRNGQLVALPHIDLEGVAKTTVLATRLLRMARGNGKSMVSSCLGHRSACSPTVFQ